MADKYPDTKLELVELAKKILKLWQKFTLPLLDKLIICSDRDFVYNYRPRLYQILKLGKDYNFAIFDLDKNRCYIGGQYTTTILHENDLLVLACDRSGRIYRVQSIYFPAENMWIALLVEI